jgi:uridine phosphorylase
VVNELDALVILTLKQEQYKENLTSLNIIRVGTSGSTAKRNAVDSMVASTHGLGLDNLMNFYLHNNNEEEKQLLQSFNTHTQLLHGISAPYITGAGDRC